MAWYTREIDTIDIDDADTAETDRMWRKIDPVLHDRMK